MKGIDRRLLSHLVDVVWSEANEDESVPSTEWSKKMILKAIERRREEKYSHYKKHQVLKAENTEQLTKLEPSHD